MAQDCKPHKTIHDDFLDKDMNYYGGVIGIEGTIAEQTITSILVSKQDDGTYILTCSVTYNDRAGNISFHDDTKFDVKTAKGIKSFQATSIVEKDRTGIASALETAELSLTVSKKDIEYLRDNPLISYQIESFEAVSRQGTVNSQKAKTLQSQMSCLLDGKETVLADTNVNTTSTPPLLENIKLNESTASYNNEISIMFGNSLLDHLGEGNIRLALVGSYTKRISQRIALGFHVGMTRSKLVEESYINIYTFNPAWGTFQGDIEEITYTYTISRFFVGPKVSVIAYENSKFQLFGSASVSVGLQNTAFTSVFADPSVDATPPSEAIKKVVFNYDLYAGAHYFLNEHFGISATVGMGISRFRIGFSFQF